MKCINIYIYKYKCRERERERKRESGVCLCKYLSQHTPASPTQNVSPYTCAGLRYSILLPHNTWPLHITHV